MSSLLEVSHLKVLFHTQQGDVPAVDDVSFQVEEGETLCIVGESGCGKSATVQAVMKLVPTPPGEYAGGKILLEGRDLLPLSTKEMIPIRGHEMSMIFQEPMTSLNPVKRIGSQVGEVLEIHRKDLSPRKILIADEPTTALDVTIQAQILDLIRQLKEKTGMTVLLITHDLGVVAEMAQRVLVMYSGKVVEQGEVGALFRAPLHPYTEGLLACLPRVDQDEEELYTIPGQVSNPANFPKGCRFHPRCPYCREICKETSPELREVDGRLVACHFLPGERVRREEAVL